MIVLLDTSTAVCNLTLIVGDEHYDYSWNADRTLAKGLLAFLQNKLGEHQIELPDIHGIGFMKGPGSFTGLRIGTTVANTLARELEIPIVGMTGDNWQNDSLARLQRNESDGLVLPDYGRPARITTPKK